ncbi:restriction endonuclease subunit S [Streptomyces blattellae]|uniref:restriction endonuclease subunit S n=1 Tax=Streptomyces blattellae TaxID=2569855 RepID=UPI0012B93705|nr:restriction endonuclease subunit S [Streptomyces blattellae]
MQKTLGNVCTQIIDSEHKTAPAATPGTTFGYSVGTPHIRNGRLLLNSAIPVDKDTFQKWTVRGVPQRDDLILSREAPVGQIARVEEGQRVCLRQRTVLLRPNSDVIHPRYLLYALMAPTAQQRMHSKAAGSTVPHLNIKEIRALPLDHLPPLSEQQAVVDILGALDDKVAINERIAENTVTLGRALLSQTVEVDSQECEIRDIADLSYGKALPEPKRRPGRTPVFGCTGQVGWHDAAITLTKLPVVGRKGANAGHVSWMWEPGWVIDTAYHAQAKIPEISPEALYFILDSAGFKSLLGDSAVPGVNRNQALRLRVRIPALGQIDRFGDHARALLGLSIHARTENRTLTALRDTLLPHLITGKLRIKDAERAVEEAV